MVYKSNAQRRFFHSKAGKMAGITKKDIMKYDRLSKGKKLPERVGVKKVRGKYGLRRIYK